MAFLKPLTVGGPVQLFLSLFLSDRPGFESSGCEIVRESHFLNEGLSKLIQQNELSYYNTVWERLMPV